MGKEALPDFDWPNFGYFFADVVSRFADRVAIRYRTRGERAFDEWSYARLGAEGRGLAACLVARGLSAGDRVLLWSENRPEWAVAYFALVAAGLVAVPVDILLPEDDISRIIASAEPAAIVASGKFSERLAEVSPKGEQPRVFVGIDGRPPRVAPSSALSWREAVAEGESSGRALPDPSAIASDALASLIFTSGTTGRPKAVMLGHRGIIENLGASIHALPIYKEDVFMCVLPLHHTYPTTCSLLSPLAVGASITICEKVIGKVILDDVRDSGGSVMIGVPILYDKLAGALLQGVKAKALPLRAAVGALRAVSRVGIALGTPWIGRFFFKSLRDTAGLGSLRLLVAGGGPLSSSTAGVFDELGFNIVQGYGMSENGPLISTNSPERHDHRSAGMAVRRTDLRIAKTSSGDEIGEIQVRSPSLMKGYWKDSEASAAALTEDGWLRTGDLGRIDSRGFIFITGRIKSLIVTAGGKNVYPEEIEALFEGSRIVREALVLGKAADSGGPAVAAEEVAAVIVPDMEAITADLGAGDPATLRELVKIEVERVNRSLPPYKKVSSFHVRPEEFEKTSSRKIKRYLYRTWREATTLRV